MIMNRDLYIKKMISLMNNGRVKIITGIRRCGKSFLYIRKFHFLIDRKMIKENEKVKCYLCL